MRATGSKAPRRAPRSRIAVAGLSLAALLLTPRPADAYPTAIVFSPSGEALPFGTFGTSLFTGMIGSPLPPSFGFATGGVTVGALPSFTYRTTPVGDLAFAGAEVGLDAGVDSTGSAIINFNTKIQLFAETKYWPATSIGFFQIAPDAKRNAALGYIMASKALKVRDAYIGQFSLGLMRSFGDRPLVAPNCLTSGAPHCVFRGSIPFEDENGAILAGYFSPWLGPVSLGIDYVGGTSDVSSANISIDLRLWHDDHGGFAILVLGGFLGNDRRSSPPGPGAVDGLFVQFTFVASLTKVFGDPTREWGRPPKQQGGRGVRPEDPFDAPPLKPPEGTPVTP